MDIMFADALESHRRAEPLPEKPYHLIPHSDDFVIEEETESDDDNDQESEAETEKENGTEV